MQMRTVSSPETPEAGSYANAKDLTGHRRLLYISGQIPETADGYVPQDFEEQARLVFKNIQALLKRALTAEPHPARGGSQDARLPPMPHSR
ncbi:MAG: RidA family protein [Frankiaceae bacterium]